MSTGPIEFGLMLRARREQRGVALADIARSTNISKSLLQELERGNACHWPNGIYRRAFMREYAIAVGLPPAQTVEEFLRLFPAKGDPPREAPASSTPTPLRLTLALDAAGMPRPNARNLRDAAVVLGGVLATGGILSYAFDTTFLTMAGLVALVWYPLAAAVLGDATLRGVLRVMPAWGTRAIARLTGRRLPHAAPPQDSAEALPQLHPTAVR